MSYLKKISVNALTPIICVLFCAGLHSCSYSGNPDANTDFSDSYRKYTYHSAIIPKGLLRDNDIELFKDSPVWRIAKAVYEQDTQRIFEECKRNLKLIDYREPKYGMTLLYWSIYNKRYYAARCLLIAGADPNLPDNKNIPPIVDAAFNEQTSVYLRLLLKYGANPNYRIQLSKKELYPVICLAAGTNLENTKVLVDAGADINDTSDGISSAFGSAVGHDIFIAEYLLNKGANFDRPIFILDGDTTYAIDAIKKAPYMSDSESVGAAQRVLKFLREHGADSSIK